VYDNDKAFVHLKLLANPELLDLTVVFCSFTKIVFYTIKEMLLMLLHPYTHTGCRKLYAEVVQKCANAAHR
jgi:hypothetical protein